MKLKRTGLVRVGAWILTGLLAADIGLQLGGVEIGSKWEWREMGRRFSERLLKGAVNQANLAAFYYDGKQKKYRVAEYMPSPEDLEAVAEENTAVLLEDMAGENSEAVRKAQEDSERAETESEAGTEYVETLAVRINMPSPCPTSINATIGCIFLMGIKINRPANISSQLFLISIFPTSVCLNHLCSGKASSANPIINP